MTSRRPLRIEAMTLSQHLSMNRHQHPNTLHMVKVQKKHMVKNNLYLVQSVED